LHVPDHPPYSPASPLPTLRKIVGISTSLLANFLVLARDLSFFPVTLCDHVPVASVVKTGSHETKSFAVLLPRVTESTPPLQERPYSFNSLRLCAPFGPSIPAKEKKSALLSAKMFLSHTPPCCKQWTLSPPPPTIRIRVGCVRLVTARRAGDPRRPSLDFLFPVRRFA